MGHIVTNGVLRNSSRSDEPILVSNTEASLQPMDCLMSHTGLVPLPHESAQSFETLQDLGVIGDTQTIDRDAVRHIKLESQLLR